MKTLLTVLITIATCIALHAQSTVYKAGEFSVDGFGGANTDLSTARLFSGVGVQYYITENLGLGAYTSLDNLSGHTIENASLRALWRVPIEKHSFYAFGGATRVFHDDTQWLINLGPGYQLQLSERVGVWLELALNKDVEDETRDPYASVRAGVRFTF